MTLRGDFHMHTHFSHDCLTTPEALVERCLRVGLNCIAVTDHNSLEGGRAAQQIAPFTVIVGAEIKSTAGEITGLFLREDVPAGLDPVETARRIKEQGALVSVPHPFTGMGRSALDRATATDLLPYIDIVEGFNARTMRASDNADARRFAVEHGLPVTAVSDAHTARELGRTYHRVPGVRRHAGGVQTGAHRGNPHRVACGLVRPRLYDAEQAGPARAQAPRVVQERKNRSSG